MSADPWAAGFPALWHPELALAACLLAVAYFQVIGPLRSRFAGAGPVPGREAAAFCAGLFALYVAQGSPVALLANSYLLSAHMLQMVLVVFVAPPLVLSGIPPWMLQPLVGVPWLRRGITRLTHPVTAAMGFIIAFSLFLLPPLTDYALHSGLTYLLEHVASALAAFCLWWPVCSRLPEAPALDRPARLLFAFAIEVLMTLPFALVTFASTPVYPQYAAAPRVWSGISALRDQELGGIIMRLGSMASFGVLLVRTFFLWAAREPAVDADLLVGAPAPARVLADPEPEAAP